MVETFDFRKGTGNTALLKVHTLHRDAQADGMRARLQTSTVSKLGQDYLDYYRKSYGGIRMVEPLRVSDDRAGNLVTLDESYEIDAPFAENANGKREFVLEAYLITEQTANPDQTVRTSPLARRFPLNIRHEIVAYLPGEWTIRADNLHITDPAFEYRSSMQFHQGKLEIAHELRNKSDHVSASRLGEFLKKLKTARDGAYYTLEDNSRGKAVPAARTQHSNDRDARHGSRMRCGGGLVAAKVKVASSRGEAGRARRAQRLADAGVARDGHLGSDPDVPDL